MAKLKVLSLFDGLSCGQIALNKIGITPDTYYASEIDKYCIQVTQKNYPNTIQLGSIIDLKTESLPRIDLLFGGSPCQSFSSAGNGKGFDGKSGLFWEYVRVLNETQPTFFLLENVVMKKEWEDIITEALGVKPIKINSRTVSAQNRPRLYWTNIPNVSIPEDKGIVLKDIIETDIPENSSYLIKQ
jgi:DNA (cytosine-5)-methyltransferase 3A